MPKKIAKTFDESPEAIRAFRPSLDLATLSPLNSPYSKENLPVSISDVSAVVADVPVLLKNE